MKKNLGELGKILVTAIISIAVTYITLSQTVIQGKAGVDYVDKRDSEIKEQLMHADKEMKDNFIIVLKELSEQLKTQNQDIKKILEKI